MASTVDSQTAAVADMAKEWPQIVALCGGTRSMRDAGESLMPRFPGEDKDDYAARIAIATLFPAFSRTTEVNAAKPLSKAITLEGFPTTLDDLLENIDGEGATLHAYAGSLMLECLRPGLVGVLIDVPPADGVRTKADEDEAGIRPYCATYKAQSILGWRASGGNLTQLRLLETITEPDGDFGEKVITQVRVLSPGKWEIWRIEKDASGNEVWAEAGSGEHKVKGVALDRIPFVFFYGIRDGLGIGRPPLLDLAYLNVKHWQSQSDQDNILHVARVPILFGKGFPEDYKLSIGSKSATLVNSADADLTFVEHTGQAIGAGSASLADLEDQMRQIGAELLVQRPNVTTATQTVSEGEGSKSILQRITENFEESLEEALEWLCTWSGEAADVEVTMFKDFGAASLSDQSANTLLGAADKGYVSPETAFEGLQRRNILPPGKTWEDEKKRLAAAAKDKAASSASAPQGEDGASGEDDPPEDEVDLDD
jgi:hypothetical protein